MALNSRAKGYRGESEAIGLLQPVVTEVCLEKGCPEIVLRRNQDQRYAGNQYDVIGLPWIAVEVKRVEPIGGVDWRAGQLRVWWEQVRAATLKGQTSVLMYRKNRGPWNVRFRPWVEVVPGKRVKMTVDTDLASFLTWLRELLRVEIRDAKKPRAENPR